MGGVTGGDQFVGDALGLIRRNREAQADRATLATAGARAARRPCVAIAEFTPISSPFMFTSAPPELPGLMAASV